ncbi:MAG TPA: barstar family protein [Phycisphaerales bacterium]|nr:barstar family protein [Phycisphaerales bacterium]
MASFTPEDQLRHELDFLLMREGAAVLYLKEIILQADLAWLAAREYRIDEIECVHALTERDLHRVVAGTLSFPNHYGQCLSALDDCLYDLDFDRYAGRVVLLRSLDLFWHREPEVASAFVDVFEEHSRHRLLFGHRLLVLAKVADPGFHVTTRHARAPMAWNPREWLDRNRLVNGDDRPLPA